MAGYLPQYASLIEAERWLADQTDETWPLPRLVEAGVRVYVWIEPPPLGSADRDVWVNVVCGGRPEGCLCEFVFSGDTHRILADRTAVLSLARTHMGKLVKFDPPIPVEIAGLRFTRNDLESLVSNEPKKVGPLVKRSELIERNRAEWPNVDQDLREASRRSVWLAPAKGSSGRWFEGTALALARSNGRLVEPANPEHLRTWLQSGAKRK